MTQRDLLEQAVNNFFNDAKIAEKTLTGAQFVELANNALGWAYFLKYDKKSDHIFVSQPVQGYDLLMADVLRRDLITRAHIMDDVADNKKTPVMQDLRKVAAERGETYPSEYFTGRRKQRASAMNRVEAEVSRQIESFHSSGGVINFKNIAEKAEGVVDSIVAKGKV
jgi:excinuclease UvrABC helicase subunit UvrB